MSRSIMLSIFVYLYRVYKILYVFLGENLLLRVANKVPFYYYFHQFNLIVLNLSNTLTAIYKSRSLTETIKMPEPNSM